MAGEEQVWKRAKGLLVEENPSRESEQIMSRVESSGGLSNEGAAVNGDGEPQPQGDC